MRACLRDEGEYFLDYNYSRLPHIKMQFYISATFTSTDTCLFCVLLIHDLILPVNLEGLGTT